MRTVSEWLNWLHSADWERWARGTYGQAWSGRRELFQTLLTTAAEQWGLSCPVFLVRAPGRLNLMGRHIDHRGGFVHPIALPREILVAAQPCDDDWVVLEHVHPEAFPAQQFRISEVCPSRPLSVEEWERWTREEAPSRKGAGWGIYAQAAAATIVNWQQELGVVGNSWRGVKAIVTGDIPPEAGLSSSSALFVALLLTLLQSNEATILRHRERWLKLAEICGYGEWFVGTRGGAGDHAAILLSEQGKVTRIGFFPITVAHLPFPEGVCLVVMDSGERAHKASGARAEFNRRVAAYEVGMLLWHEQFPHLRERLKHLRDAAPSRLGEEATVYQLLQALPRYASFEELLSLLPHHAERLQQWRVICQGSPDEAVTLEVRGTCWFGIAECERSERFGEALAKGDVMHLGELMNVSHDGDRVTRWRNGDAEPFHFPTDDVALTVFAQNRVPFWKQAGSYRCSTPAIDLLVDTALRLGALGAQLAGAGLGGCAMALVERESAEALAEQVANRYQRVLHLQLAWFIAEPCKGAEVLLSPERLG